MTRGTRSRASFSFPSSSATTTSRFVQVNTALRRQHVTSILPAEPANNSPFCNFLVSSEDAVLNVDGMISHAPQDEGLVQGSDNKDGVMVLWKISLVSKVSPLSCLTSVTADGLSSPEEAEVAGPSVGLAHIAAADQPGRGGR